MAVVNIVCNNLISNPMCPHGPTLKFIRKQKGGNKKTFFACSTYRDRKDCSFYIKEAGEQSAQQRLFWELKTKEILPKIDPTKSIDRLNIVRSALAKERIYCHTCDELDISAQSDNHLGHQIETAISNALLANPTQMIKPKEGSKKEAQYLFSLSSIKVIVDNLKKAGVSRVLCLGTPRIHEHIQANNQNMQSLLLDFDHRHSNFWPPEKFIWYNMFNRHIMLEDKQVAKQTIKRFLAGREVVALVMDPPFGGHVAALSATVIHFQRLAAKHNHASQLLVVWAFPYFRERHILESCPSLVMMDYKVQYDNHKDFNNSGKGRKLGSPVRLFTNMDPREFELPTSEGYRLCRPCGRWVASENRHCRKCNACTSKDGRTYMHCDLCNKCVKPEWKHCGTCSRCSFSTHICQRDGTATQTPSLHDIKLSISPVRSDSSQTESSKSSIGSGKRKRKKQ